MDTSVEIDRAREEVSRTRAELSDTLDELATRVTAPVHVAREKLDVISAVRENPWTAVAVALGAGVAVATSGADRRAATLAADGARTAGESGARAVKSAAQATAQAVKRSPSKTRDAVTVACDSIATKLVLGFIESLRKPDLAPPTVGAPRRGLGYVDETTPERAEA